MKMRLWLQAIISISNIDLTAAENFYYRLWLAILGILSDRLNETVFISQGYQPSKGVEA